jgi:ligand-binding sensor domain-containing protein/signal transduction histidine kinase
VITLSIKKKFFICALFLLLFVSLFPQTFSTRNYSAKDGIPGTIVWCLHQDANGYLWVGADKGLCRFDGIEFHTLKTAGLSSRLTWTIFEDRKEYLHIGTQGNGVQCLSPGDGESFTRPLELARDTVLSIAEDACGNFWFGTTRGMSRFDGKNLETYTTHHGLPSNLVYKAAVDKNRNLWAATKKGICRFKKDRFETLNIPEPFQARGFFTLLLAPGGRVWIGTPGGLLRFDNGAFTAYTMRDGLVDNHIRALCQDSGGNTWVGTANGITVLSNAGKPFVSLTVKNGLPHNFIDDILQDREGNMWIATHGGLSCLRTLNIASYSIKDGLAHNVVYNIIQDRKGRYWIGTSAGLSRLENGKFKTYTTRDGLAGNSIHALLEDRRGKLWIGTINGLVYFSSGRFTPFAGVRGNIFKITEARDGAIWIGGSSGIHRVREGILSPPPFKNSPTGISNIFEDSRGNLWFVSWKGLHQYSNQRLTLFSKKNGMLPDNRIHAIFEDSRGSLWFGGQGGLSCYREGAFVHYSSQNGLPDNACHVIMEDHRGQIWIGTENGLAAFDGEIFRTYTARKHGLTTDYWITGFKDRQGTFWLGSQEGVTRFTSPPLKINTVRPPIYITNVNVLEKDMPLAQLGQLSHEQNYIRFQFRGLCFSAPGSVVYRYKLANIDARWRETQIPSVPYHYLPPGKYQFRVKAMNNDGIESSEPAEVFFEILPPFWRTWWFTLLVLSVIITAAALVVRWRYNRAREKAELKARNSQLVMAQRMELVGNLAAGTVHDLKNLLSIILGYTRIMSRKLEPGGEDYQHLETIKDTASTAVQMSRQILSLTRFPEELPGEVELGELLEEILKTLEITLPKKIKRQWKLPDGPVRFAIHPARFQQIVINLCQNAAHAMPAGGELTVSLSRSPDNEILLQVNDTGTGIEAGMLDKIFDPLFTTREKGKGTGLGLFVVKQIVDEYKGAIQVQSKPGKGTIFTVRLYAPGGQEPF